MHIQAERINFGELGRFVLVAGLVASCVVPSEGAEQWGMESQLDEFGEVLKLAVSEPVGPIVPQESPYEDLRAQLVLFCKSDDGLVVVRFSRVVNFSGSEYVEDVGWKNEAEVRVDGGDAGRWYIAHENEASAIGFVERYLSRDQRFEQVAGQINAIARGKTLERATEELVGLGKPKVLIQKMV